MRENILQVKKYVIIMIYVLCICIANNTIYSANSNNIIASTGSYDQSTASTVSSGFDPGLVNEGEGIPALEGIFNNIWSTIVFIVQILSVLAIVLTGLRYMFASADKKADLKAGLFPLIIGSILVFSASTVASFIVKAATEAGIK